MSIFSSLTRSQKEAVGLLQIGTFLEYFDLMLYVHMAVLLNELFFPKTDPHTAALLSAFAFCSTYVLRPFGALIFGYIGDTIGRKTTVIITTTMMSISCIIMANLPTYAQVGITATWVITICRIIQGISSMGEVMGAEIYVTEITKPPIQYSAVSSISIAASIGSIAALGIAALVTTSGFNWRIAFWVGAGIAVVGSIARARLRETPEFFYKKKQMKRLTTKNNSQNVIEMLKEQNLIKGKIVTKNIIYCFLVYCGWPLSFYLSFIYFNQPLKDMFGYTPEDIILRNFFLSIILCVVYSIWTVLGYRIHPLKILKVRGIIAIIFACLLPLLILSSTHSFHLFTLQAMILILTLGGVPAASIFVKGFPILKRVTVASLLYALSRAIMYIITSFGLVYLTETFGHYGLWFIMIPVTIGFLCGVRYFEKLENISGHIPKHNLIPIEVSSAA